MAPHSLSVLKSLESSTAHTPLTLTQGTALLQVNTIIIARREGEGESSTTVIQGTRGISLKISSGYTF